MPILETVENSLKFFRPKSHRELVALTIARRFNDVDNLARYLNVAAGHPKKVLIEAARLADRDRPEGGGSPAERFFALLTEWQQKERP